MVTSISIRVRVLVQVNNTTTKVAKAAAPQQQSRQLLFNTAQGNNAHGPSIKLSAI